MNVFSNDIYPYCPDQIVPMEDQELQRYAAQRWIEAGIDAGKSIMKAQQRKEEIRYANELAEQRDVKKANLLAENFEKRELTTRAIAVDSDGKFVIESTLPTGEKKFSKPVCRETGFRACWLYALDVPQKDWLFSINFFGVTGSTTVILKKPSTQIVMRAFREVGVHFRFSRSLRAEMEAAVVAWLIQNATIVEIPKRIGWNQMSDGEWYFEQDAKKTLEGICDD